ncbi:2-amino-4-hydroxy-6-hydroxymethyldihydropteridine diphosphokinase [Thiohalorhabdus methylotrophus]|uniref:2-amino-4-hydroxy-6-hydroxymethyldihydropteridine pyrophosphokinase n=1 Tax=Thiohalorhabdus methylotrophus TaxID=3242694 RepID=A0ABV4TYE5_9GAMM
MSEIFVGLGSNQGDSRTILQQGLARLAEVVPGKLARVSGLYRTGPVGYTQQPDFLNAVALFHGEPLPEQWLQRLLDVEAELGRRRDGPRWGPRSLDLDLLAVDDRTLETAHLLLPHPRLSERRFVLVPWAEIAPDFRLPDGERIRDLERACPDEGRVELVEGSEWAAISPENDQA